MTGVLLFWLVLFFVFVENVFEVGVERVWRTRIMVPVTMDGAGCEVVDWKGMGCLGRALSDVACNRVYTGLGHYITTKPLVSDSSHDVSSPSNPQNHHPQQPHPHP